MQYLIDEDLSVEIAVVARGLGLDAVGVQELGHKGWKDEDLLALAAQEGRCVVTANRDDFRRFTNSFAAQGLPHAGILVVLYTLGRRGPVAVTRALLAFERARGAFPMAYLFDFLRPAD